MDNKLRESPYNTSYDPNSKYYMVLFKAGRALQGREVNDMQMYTQEQIRRLSNHLFTNGSVTSGGSSRLVKTDYVTIQEDLDLSQFNVGTVLVGMTSDVRGTIIKTVNQTLTDPATIYVNYTGTGKDGITNKFMEGEVLTIADSSIGLTDTATVRCTDCEDKTAVDPIGFGYIFYIDEGLMYFEGFHINFETQNHIVSKYKLPIDVKIGFNYTQTIVSSIQDQSLLDNALGYPNVSAPGADRLKIDLILSTLPNSVDAGDRFIMMMRIDQFGVVSYIRSDTDYGTIMKEFARRTYETNGNYTIKPYRLSVLNHKKQTPTDATGVFLTGNDESLCAVVGPSISYVMGYRNETVSDVYVEFPKARTTNTYQNYIKRFDERSYIIVKGESKNVIPNSTKTSFFMDNSIVSLYSEPTAGTSVAGDVIGTLKVSDVSIFSKLENLYKLYVHDISMTPGKTFEDVKGIACLENQYTANAYRTDDRKFILNNTNAQALIFPLDKANIKTLRSIHNSKNGSIQIQMRKFFKSTLDANGKITFDTTSNEFFTSVTNETLCYVERNGERTNVFLDSLNTQMSATSCSIDLGSENGGAVIGLLQTVQRTNQKEKTKTLVDSVLMPDTAPTNVVGTKIFLKAADAYSITSIGLYVKTAKGGYDFLQDVTDNFTLKSNITDYAYLESYIELNKKFDSETFNDLRLQIDFKYFAHSGSTGYFTVDSYADVFNDDSNTITYENIAKYKSPSTNVQYNLTQSIDFRPLIVSGLPLNSLLPAMGETMMFDIEYYLGRSDLLIINKDGEIKVHQGIPSETPIPPKNPDDSMTLYELWIPAYTYSYKDVKMSFVENKRFTMRDIGKIEKRVERSEYYITLNMAQQSIADMNIKDKDGFDRYKNGFLTDDFDKFYSADIANIEFKAALDTNQKELRPKFNTRSRKLKLNEALSNHFYHKSGMICLPYENVVIDKQPFSTKTVSITPYLIAQKKGQVMLTPNMDVFTDNTVLPEMVVDIDTGVDAFHTLADAAGFNGLNWGDWTEQNRTTVGRPRTTSSSSTGRSGGIIGGTTTTTVTTTTTTVDVNEQRQGTNSTLGSRTDTHDLGTVVRDVQMQPYIRAQTIKFNVVGLAPNTIMYPFFDRVNVSKYCRDVGFQVTPENQHLMVERMSWGGKLITDAKGQLLGEFQVPGATFLSGQRFFVLTTNNKFDIEDDEDLSWSFAQGEFLSNGLDVESQNITMNVTTPTLTVEKLVENRTRRETEVSQSITTTTRPDRQGGGGGSGGDPIAQGIGFDEDTFVSGMRLYFSNVNTASNVIWFQLRTMVNGYPSNTVITEKRVYNLDSIPTSENASVPYDIMWDFPAFLKGGEDYCLVVGGDDPGSRIFVAHLNQQLIEDPSKILEEQPNMQSMFRSVNGKTWTADQYETVKYEVLGAKFDNSSNMELVFNQINEPVLLGTNPIETEVGLSRVRVHCMDHGFTINDRVNITLSAKTWIDIQIDNAGIPPQKGQVIKTTTFNGIIDDTRKGDKNNIYQILVTDVSGTVAKNHSFTCAPMEQTAADAYKFELMGSTKPIATNIPEVTGTIISDFSTEYPNNQLNGIPVSDFNRELVVIEVDSINSFIVETSSPAKFTGRHGGDRTSVLTQCNIKYDVFNVSGGYLPYGAIEKWNYEGTMLGRNNTPSEADDNVKDKMKPFSLCDDIFLDRSHKILSDSNEKRVFGAEKSVNIYGVFEPTTTQSVSPVINIESFSMILVSNMIGDFGPNEMNVSPNAKDRYVDETDPVNGSATFKYVSKDVRLKDPASDIMIMFDVYKAIDADFDIYWKSLPMYSEKSLAEIPWVKLEFDKSYHSFDLSDRIEYTIRTDDPSNVFAESDHDDFVTFKIKIVGKATNPAKAPLFKTLRVIAVT